MNLKTGALTLLVALVALAAAMPNPDVHHKHPNVTGHHHVDEGGHRSHRPGKHHERLNHTETHAKHYRTKHLEAKRKDPKKDPTKDGIYGFYECSSPKWKGDCHWTQVLSGDAKCYNRMYKSMGSFGPDHGVMCTVYADADCPDSGTKKTKQMFPGLPDFRNSFFGAGNDSPPASYKCELVVVEDITMKTPLSERDVGQHVKELDHTETEHKSDGIKHLEVKREDPIYGFYECSLPEWKGDCRWTQVLSGEPECHNRAPKSSGSFGPDRGVVCTLYEERDCPDQGMRMTAMFPGLAEFPKSYFGALDDNPPGSYKCRLAVVKDVGVNDPPLKRDVGKHLGESKLVHAGTDPKSDGLELLRAKRAALVSATNVTLNGSEHGNIKRADPVYGFYECSQDNFKGQCRWTQVEPNVVRCYNPVFGESTSFGPDPGVSCIMYSISDCMYMSYVSKPILHPGASSCKGGKFWKWGSGLSPCAQSWSCAVTAVGNARDPLAVTVWPGYGNGEQPTVI